MEPQTFDTQPAAQSQAVQAPVKNTKKIVWVIVGILAAVILLPFLIFALTKVLGGNSGNALFYEALSNASQKDKVQQLTLYKQWQEGEATTTPPYNETLSLTEFDTTTQKFNTIDASTGLFDDAEKCLEGKPYRYLLRNSEGIGAMAAVLNDPAAEEAVFADPNGPYNPCNFKRSSKNGKFSDGIIPVGMTAEKATSWINYFKTREVFAVKDEGMTDYKGKSVRKLSFKLNPKFDTSVFFYAVRDGDTGKTDGLGFNWQINFGYQLSSNLATPPSMKGFYLIDEQTKLPVYSEVVSETPEGKNAAQLPSVTQKVSYSYPSQLSITKDTKLPLLQ